MSEDELIEACTAIGVHVIFTPHYLAGAYIHSLKLIIIDSNQSPAEQRFTLAHEYVHAALQHDGRQEEHVERRVDELAASLLISPVEYALAEQLAGCHPVALAAELAVPVECVQAYQSRLVHHMPAMRSISA